MSVLGGLLPFTAELANGRSVLMSATWRDDRPAEADMATPMWNLAVQC